MISTTTFPLTTPLADCLALAETNGACDSAPNTFSDVLRANPAATLADVASHLEAPEWAVWFARHVLKRRWPDAEPVIARDAFYAYNYTLEVIGARWPEAEPFIAQDAFYAYRYARDVIGARWPEAEPFIAQNASAACQYARDVIRGRWIEAEPVIAQYFLPAYRYASDVIRGPWPEAGITSIKEI